MTPSNTWRPALRRRRRSECPARWCGGARGGIAVLALRDQVAPPTINYFKPDPECDLDPVPNQSRPMGTEYALTNSFGFGGTNGALVFKRYTDGS